MFFWNLDSCASKCRRPCLQHVIKNNFLTLSIAFPYAGTASRYMLRACQHSKGSNTQLYGHAHNVYMWHFVIPLHCPEVPFAEFTHVCSFLLRILSQLSLLYDYAIGKRSWHRIIRISWQVNRLLTVCVLEQLEEFQHELLAGGWEETLLSSLIMISCIQLYSLVLHSKNQ